MRVNVYSGTRADFGKMAPIIDILLKNFSCEIRLFVGGIHWLPEFGLTGLETIKRYENDVHIVSNFSEIRGNLSSLCGETLNYFSKSDLTSSDLCLVHGDRADALGFAIATKTKNCTLMHFEGGEQSGTIDNLYRDAISQFADHHVVTNIAHAERLATIGIEPDCIETISAPENLYTDLPSLSDIMTEYDLRFKEYGIVLLHPDTTDRSGYRNNVNQLRDFLSKTERQFYILQPNFDDGYLDFYKNLLQKISDNHPRIQVIKNLRFKSFQTLLANSCINIGNSSSFVREAPKYGGYSIILGHRQDNRTSVKNVRYLINGSTTLQTEVELLWGNKLSVNASMEDSIELENRYIDYFKRIIHDA